MKFIEWDFYSLPYQVSISSWCGGVSQRNGVPNIHDHFSFFVSLFFNFLHKKLDALMIDDKKVEEK